MDQGLLDLSETPLKISGSVPINLQILNSHFILVKQEVPSGSLEGL